MKIALLTHSHHRITKSADFLASLLTHLGQVEFFYDESWNHRRAAWVDSFQSTDFDCIVIFQAHECFQYITSGHSNIVFIPMYDAMIWQGSFYWRDIFNSSKVLCFSSALYREVHSRTRASVFFQYYPDPTQFPQVLNYDAPRGYYWRRTNDITPHMVGHLARGVKFDLFSLHDVPDPGSEIGDAVSRVPVSARNYRITGWLPSSTEHLNDLSKHNIYFAPRIREGIGFGFLKAMAMGLCVVAPDTATHNEYISQGCTGLLYQPANPTPVDLHRFREMGLRARDSMECGHRRWLAGLDRFLQIFATPTRALDTNRFKVDSWIKPPETSDRTQSKGRFPSVAVVTVCLNAKDQIEKTIQSVLGQDYPNLEYVIHDGGSTDGTVELVRKYEHELAAWTVGPDDGVYPAMQQSLANVRSDWVLFMNAGDFFARPDSLTKLFSNAPNSADIVFGHHIFRHPGGLDELRLAADFDWMWRRLQEGSYDVQYPVGFPAHQATAVRTGLLRQFKFDPMFRIAADHEFLWRNRSRKARFFNSDEVVSVYLGGGVSAHQMERCKQEWCVIALRYGTNEGSSNLTNCTPSEKVTAIHLERQYHQRRLMEMFDRNLISRLPGARRIAEFLLAAYQAARVSNRLNLLGLSSQLSLSVGATLHFTPEQMTHFLSETHGLAAPEAWGVWTLGKTVELVFREAFPVSFTMFLKACAFGPNIDQPIPIAIGDSVGILVLKARRPRTYRISFSRSGSSNKLSFVIPNPTAPADLPKLRSTDTRQIGVGLISIRIEPCPGN